MKGSERRARRHVIEVCGQAVGEADAAAGDRLAVARFLSAINHDLRQPLHAMNLFVGALDALADDGRVAKIAGDLESCIEALDESLKVALDYCKLEASLHAPARSEVALAGLLDALCEPLRPIARKRDVALRLRPTRLSVRVDPVLLAMALGPIVSNALKFAAAGGAVLIACRRAGSGVRIEVWDTGPGVEKGDFERLAEPLWKGPPPPANVPPGLGLGLAVASRAARLMAARLTVCSRPGVGSVFALALP